MSNITDLLGPTGLARSVSAETLDALAGHAVVRRLGDGERWISRHDRAKGIAVIVEGGLRSTTVMPDGREYVFSIMGKDDVWGIVSTIDGCLNSNDVYAYGDTTLLCVGRSVVQQMMDDRPDFSKWVIGILCQRLRMASVVLEDRALQPLEVRAARLLLSMMGMPSGQGGAPHLGGSAIAVTQETLRKMLGCSRPTINQQLKKLERAGLIGMHYGTIEIIDKAGLGAISGATSYPYF